MKVYGLREMATEYGYMPVLGYHSSVVNAKKQAKEGLERTAQWDIAQYDIQGSITQQDWIDLLNADCISSPLEGRCPRDYVKFVKIVFESAALKRYRKNKNKE